MKIESISKISPARKACEPEYLQCTKCFQMWQIYVSKHIASMQIHQMIHEQTACQIVCMRVSSFCFSFFLYFHSLYFLERLIIISNISMLVKQVSGDVNVHRIRWKTNWLIHSFIRIGVQFLSNLERSTKCIQNGKSAFECDICVSSIVEIAVMFKSDIHKFSVSAIVKYRSKMTKYKHIHTQHSTSK